MKRLFIGIIIFLVLLFLCCQIVNNRYTQIAIDCMDAYRGLIEYPDFDLARCEKGNMILMCTGNQKIEFEMPLSWKRLFERDVHYAFKVKDDIYFVTSGAVDDVCGVLLSADNRINSNEVKRHKILDSDRLGTLYGFYFSTIK